MVFIPSLSPNQVIFDSSGASVMVVPRVVQVVGPASYATGGFLVDCSAFFSSIVAAVFIREFTTIGGASPNSTLVVNPSSTGANLYSAGKFQAVIFRAAFTPTGTNNTPAFTGSAIGGGHSCGVGCDSSHPNSTTVVAGTVAAPVFTGTPQALAFAEVGNTSGSAAAQTYEFLVYGVPI